MHLYNLHDNLGAANFVGKVEEEEIGTTYLAGCCPKIGYLAVLVVVRLSKYCKLFVGEDVVDNCWKTDCLMGAAMHSDNLLGNFEDMVRVVVVVVVVDDKLVVVAVDNCQLADTVEAVGTMHLPDGVVADYYRFGPEKEPVAAEVAD